MNYLCKVRNMKKASFVANASERKRQMTLNKLVQPLEISRIAWSIDQSGSQNDKFHSMSGANGG
ncbi:hypothetical protein EV281_10612 [Rhizobium sp. BK418]|nr:hypothetical protein EV281_10612 [Rhizobium sp. BK418]